MNPFKVGDKIRATEKAWLGDCQPMPLYCRPVREIVAADEESFTHRGTLFSYTDNDFEFKTRYDDEASLDVELVPSPAGIGLDVVEKIKQVQRDHALGSLDSEIAAVRKVIDENPAQPDLVNHPEDAKLLLAEPPVESILAEALRITDGARARDYGSAKTNHERIALFDAMWDIAAYGTDEQISAALDAVRSLAPVMKPVDDAEDVAMKMILMKVARHANTPKRDNLVDIAGYARCESRIAGFEE